MRDHCPANGNSPASFLPDLTNIRKKRTVLFLPAFRNPLLHGGAGAAATICPGFFPPEERIRTCIRSEDKPRCNLPGLSPLRKKGPWPGIRNVSTHGAGNSCSVAAQAPPLQIVLAISPPEEWVWSGTRVPTDKIARPSPLRKSRTSVVCPPKPKHRHPSQDTGVHTDFRLEHVQMRDGFCARSRKASESVPEGTVRMTDTEMAQKTPADVHGLGENQYKQRRASERMGP